MKICIFNSLPQHHEMFAHVLDYFKNNKMIIDIYTNKTNNYGWLNYYEKEYNIHVWYPISFFNSHAYDYVFLLTDDDYGYNPYWNNTTRVLVTEHDSKRELNLKTYCKHQTRQFNLRSPPSDPNTWILPVWNAILQAKYERLTVLSLGNATNNLNLPSLFSNYKEIDFILVDRDMNTQNTEPNIRKFNKLEASKLIEYASKSHYILVWPTTSYSTNHKHYSMSGSIPLAYSVGTPLLLPESYLEPLGLKGLTGIPDKDQINLEIPDKEIFLKERFVLLERRNKIFNSVFFGSLDKTPVGPGMYTAVIVEPRKHKAMRFVLKNFTDNLDYRWNFIIFHGTSNKEWLEEIIESLGSHRIKLINLNVENIDWHGYNKLISTRSFIEQIPTETFLIFQTDTMISVPGKDLIYDFIHYDYVGAPWPESILKESCYVGNGGLSLRKKSKMLEIIDNVPYPFQCPEDLYYCGINHNIPMYKPSWKESRLFSIESIHSERSFGIHKAWARLDIGPLEKQFPGIGILKELNT